MGKVSIDLSSLKAAGIYTLEIDNSQRTSETTNALRMAVGFSNKGPFNRPVLLEQDNDRLSIFGDIDSKLEHKGCFFNRMLRTLLTNGPVIALNLLKVDNSYNGPDQVNFASMSLDAATANPKVEKTHDKYGEYDYLAETIDNTIYGTTKGDSVPYIGATPFSSVYNRSRFWTPDKDLLTAAAARGLDTNDYKSGRATFEYTNLLNFANVGTEEFSLLVFKPSNMNGYDVTAETWYGGKENIPFGWIRPYDYISDYFLQVVCIKGNWTNYPILATDPIWGSYFDKKGIIKDKLNSFMGAEGISILGSWCGVIIPDFTDKQGANLNLEKKINAATERTGLLMSFNNDAANVLIYDYSGENSPIDDPDKGAWGIDIDGDYEISGSESTASYIVDMCGHGAFMESTNKTTNYIPLPLTTLDKDGSVYNVSTKKTLIPCDMQMVAYADTSAIKYVDSSSAINNISTGTYINNDYITTTLSSNILYSDNNLASLIVPTYYKISQTAKITQQTVSHSQIKIEAPTISSTPANIDVSAYVTYGEAQCLINFTVHVDTSSCIDKVITTYTTITVADKKSDGEKYNGVNFLSYNYIADSSDNVEYEINNAYYFSDCTLWADAIPVSDDVKNLFIITSKQAWMDKNIKVGDYVHNITYNNETGETQQYQLIPGLARVTKKRFYKVVTDGFGNRVINYNGKSYKYTGPADTAENGNVGFYLLTCTAPVLVENNKVMRQLPLSDDAISHSLRFIPLKGLSLSSRHRPGYDANGNLNIEDGIEKIYSVLEDEGIQRGLNNKSMIDYRYIIDTMSYGLRQELGGKVFISKTAYNRGKCTAILNLPAAKQFALSSNPYFCNSYIPETETRPALNTKYIAEGGNTEMGADSFFSLPTEDDGAKFTACFWPNLIYTENGKSTSVPPAADVANVLNRKFTGLNDPYCICANQNGILSNKYLTGLEFLADLTDREYLEPFGVNTIIKDGSNIMIYGNQTAYQAMKSDFNKLHIRENLNTVEIECEAVLKKYNFLYNTAAVRANIVAQLTPILQVMQTSGALAKYEIICDETNNTAEVIEADTCLVDVNLWFNHGMEKIVQTFTVNRYASLDD